MERNERLERQLKEIKDELRELRRLLEADRPRPSDWPKPGPNPLDPYRPSCQAKKQ